MTETSILCPECKLPWTLVAGAFPLHTSKGSPCPMSGHLPDYVNKEPHVAPLDKTADPKPARKVRSDKGTKRSQRKNWEHTDASPDMLAAERAMLSERPPTPGGLAEPGQPDELASSYGLPVVAQQQEEGATQGTSFLEAQAKLNELGASIIETMKPKKRKPRSAQYIAVTNTPVYPNQEAAEEGAKKALENRDAGCTYFVYRVREVAIAANGTYITRTGRVRKAK